VGSGSAAMPCPAAKQRDNTLAAIPEPDLQHVGHQLEDLPDGSVQ